MHKELNDTSDHPKGTDITKLNDTSHHPKGTDIKKFKDTSDNTKDTESKKFENESVKPKETDLEHTKSNYGTTELTQKYDCAEETHSPQEEEEEGKEGIKYGCSQHQNSETSPELTS
ncbi:hypothetical protein scyTo_0017895 [Scyliorhinus torazame]|uniref:Uncharacterized protein n=1 Tax=Scyliorhinus torazame TaxID=75743 RepID=A0A401Q2D0_SCYTO|nr:hypothetical protein [Scyliorhinus torazame]